MIITLKGADFSASNIGTLSSWRITRSLGTGATYEGATSVDKGAALSATVTIAEGYELGTAGVTVTMGGAVISAATVNGNVITISIAEVTGNVVIKVPTVNISTGEEEEPEIPVEPDVPSDEGDENNTTFAAVWEQGTLQANNGESDSNTRIRTKFIDATHLESLVINYNPAIYAVALYWYSSLNNKSSVNSPSWQSENININANDKTSNYVRIVAKKVDDSNITPDDAENISVNISVKTSITEINTVTWLQGAISGTVSETADATRIKTDFINAENLVSLTTDFDSSIYNVAVYWYSDADIKSLKNSPVYQAENLNITVGSKLNNYLRIVVKRLDNANILPSEAEAINLRMKFYTEGDE